jgi:hypothetical protein
VDVRVDQARNDEAAAGIDHGRRLRALHRRPEGIDAVAGEKDVGVGAATIVQNCIKSGLLDEIHIDLAAVLLGGGVRLFDGLANAPVILGDPTVSPGVGVTHLRYPVRAA